MTSKFSIDNRELLQRISSGEAVVGIDFGNLIVRELAAFRLAAMDSRESIEMPLDYLQGHKDGLEWASQLAEANHPETGDWLYDDPTALAKAIRKGPDMPPAQPVADSEPVENHIGCKNALDAIVSFIKSKSNPTVKCYEELSEQLFKDNCHGIHSHVIEYILKLGEELEDLRAEQAEMQPAPVVPDDVLDALQKVARIRLDMNDFDGDRRGIADCLCDAEEALIEVVNRRAAMLAAAPHDTPALNSAQSVATVPGKWIPVSERMPEDEQEVLTINKMGHRFVSFFDKHSGLFFDRLDAPVACCIEHVLVTHWMPLPAAPQEVKGE
ncbi:DUF551 domain-containing protein [Klebsiella quasipneumoniae]|nr:DUF551 domain-containing protein [Klebsiella quasipneumoniae]MEB4702496.1 DUF551 domain-containing protein [Klebsiella quasipneumoniae]